ncbi:DNA-binding transcriptional regulator, LysR family [Bosea sp. OK403]|uniref:LysR substrate-binding domain-containing protein n=1 Tax=Bosea sp. OK403 TaxID=1855286 RepID=UPI0008F246D6|nr:LysR substrate-binding domain-containing protein [Bosea sp. OK403]SFI04490.1 DNA-binding transcriptional regulator, LysR family [Bosea sp. OK403]
MADRFDRSRRTVPVSPVTAEAALPVLPGRGLLARIDLLTLKLFITIIEEQSIAKAAERENIAASAVSKRISDLEHAVGVPLIKRHHKGVDATPAGRVFLHHSRVILRDLAQLESEVFDHSSGVRGHVRVFANDSTIFGYLPEELAEFLALHPQIRVEFEAKVSPDIIRAVAESAADIGLFAGHLPTADLTVHPYHRDRLLVVVPTEHELAGRPSLKLADVLEHDLIEQERGSSIELLLLRAASTMGRSIRGRIRVGSFDAMCRMVEAGLGVGVVPELFARRIVNSINIRAIALDEPWAIRQHKICTRDPASLPHAARLLLQHLISKAGQGEPSRDEPSQDAIPASREATSPILPRL